MSLSTGQITDAFQTALGRNPTGTELAQYSQNTNLEGSPGQQTLISQLNPNKATTTPNVSPAAGSITDPQTIIDMAQKAQIAANQPAIATLGTAQTDLTTRYQTLLDSITSAEQPAIDVNTAQANAANAARGIAPTSELAAKNVAGIVAPITTQFGQLKAQTGVSEQQDLNTLAGQIASLQAGNIPGALTLAGNINTAQQNAAAAIAAAYKPVVIQGGEALVNASTGGTIAGNAGFNTSALNTPNSSLTPGTVPSTTTTKPPVTSLATPINPVMSLGLSNMNSNQSSSAGLR